MIVLYIYIAGWVISFIVSSFIVKNPHRDLADQAPYVVSLFIWPLFVPIYLLTLAHKKMPKLADYIKEEYKKKKVVAPISSEKKVHNLPAEQATSYRDTCCKECGQYISSVYSK